MEQWDPNGFLSAGLSLAPLTGKVSHSGFYCQFLEQAEFEVDQQSSLHRRNGGIGGVLGGQWSPSGRGHPLPLPACSRRLLGQPLGDKVT